MIELKYRSGITMSLYGTAELVLVPVLACARTGMTEMELISFLK